MHIHALSDIDTSFGPCFLADRSPLENLQIFFSCCAEVASTSSKLKSVEAWSRVKSWIYPPQICVNHVVKGCLILRYKFLDDSVARKKSMRE